MNNINKFLIGAAALAVASTAHAAVIKLDSLAEGVTVNGNIYTIESDLTLLASNEYILDTITYVTNGATLTIEPGTIIRGEATAGILGTNDPGALVISRDGFIDAQGTVNNPIIFTTAALDTNSDDVADGTEASDGQAISDFLDSDPAGSPLLPSPNWDTLGDGAAAETVEYRGLWGGIVVLGNAPTSIASYDSLNGRIAGSTKLASAEIGDPFEGFVEGIAPASVGELSVYGGVNPHDNSGILRYISIRHGGSDIGAANEINGLTMGGVGDGTTIEFIEVYCNADDGYEWFGGNVNGRYLVSLLNNDDGFDIDEGYTGVNQFCFNLGADDGVNSERGGEHDGTDANFSSVDLSSVNGVTIAGTGDDGIGIKPTQAVFYNATYIGGGTAGKSGAETIEPRDSWGGAYYNSIFTEFAEALSLASDNVSAWDAGMISFRSNIWGVFAGATAIDATTLANSRTDDPFTGTPGFEFNTTGADPFGLAKLGGNFSRRTGLTPKPNGAAVTANLEPYIAGTTPVAYKGAFDPNAPLWTNGWTAGSVTGIVTD